MNENENGGIDNTGNLEGREEIGNVYMEKGNNCNHMENGEIRKCMKNINDIQKEEKIWNKGDFGENGKMCTYIHNWLSVASIHNSYVFVIY